MTELQQTLSGLMTALLLILFIGITKQTFMQTKAQKDNSEASL